MSWSTGSSAPGFRRASGRRDGGGDSKSHVRYREGAMAYEPVKYYHCHPPDKAPRWISWRRMNPGRRYYACVHSKEVSSDGVGLSTPSRETRQRGCWRSGSC
ncbi:unnamed protein product [Alopecurus aequalis]